MKKLTSLILSATIVPALALGTVAFAQEQDQGDMQADQQGIGEQRANKDEQRADEQRADEQRADEQRADEQRAGEQFMSRKPVGALYADDVIGKTVKHRQSGDDIGEIQDLIIGEDGHILGVVVRTDGFLGIGRQNVSLGWDHLEHSIGDDESVFYVDMDEEALRNAPEHERD